MVARDVALVKRAATLPIHRALQLIEASDPQDQLSKNAVKRTVRVVRHDAKRGIHHTASSISRLLKTSRDEIVREYGARGILLVNGNVYYNAKESRGFAHL
jgi:hypothetical protein